MPRQTVSEARALDLARGAEGNGVDDDEPARNLEFGEASEQERADLHRGRRRAILQDNGGGDVFAERRMRHAESRRLTDRAVLEQGPSTSSGDTFSPPRLMISFRRPVM